MTVKRKRITSENFAEFGWVVMKPRGKPTSQAREYKFWSDIIHYLIEGETEIGVCTVYRRARNDVARLERHLKTPEILIPIDAPLVLPVLRGGEAASGLQAFRVHVGEAVVTDKGVWHGACLPAGKRRSSYFVIFRRHTPLEDVETQGIEPTEIRL
jgi:ureidoglycolate hydrolase